MSLSRRSFLALSGAAASSRAFPTFAQSMASAASAGNGSLPTLPQPGTLEAADLTTLTGDEQVLLVTLQGQVNRKQPRLYLYWGTDNTNQTWLQTLNLPNHISTTPWDFLTRYRSEISGAIVYDPNLPDTVNIATAIASQRGAVIATADLAKAHQLNVLEDLTGRWTDKITAYEWALANVWPHLSNRILTAIAPTNTVATANVNWTTVLHETRPITDSSNKAVYTADLSSFLGGPAVYVRFQDAVPTDGWGPAVQQVTVTADGKTIASFTPGTAAEAPFLFDAGSSQLSSSGWRFADGTEDFIYSFTPPAGTKQLVLSVTMWNEFLVEATATAPSMQQANPNFRDYIVATQAPVFWLDPQVADETALFTTILQKAKPNTPYLGWFPLGHEMPGVTLCARYASPVVAADDFINGSVFAGVRERIDSTVPAQSKPEKVENKIYITMTMVEGDNIQYNQHRMRMIWDDPGRGSVILNWSISVLLLDIAPTILAYYQRTRTESDLLMAGPSGAGYTYPAVWPADALQTYTVHTGQYMQRTGMNTLFAYNRDGSTDLAFTPNTIDLYRKNVPGLRGIVLNYETSSAVSFIDGLPVVTLLGVNDLASGTTQLAQVASAWDGNSPLFVAAGLESWNMTPTDAKSLADTLGADFEIVRADTFFQLLRASQRKQPAS